ncbi:Uncharacterised protein [Yersinia intermedia]|uniref:Uncharacterized protein n=1 Tax=Yersinia intermedia TaxID=631 RepID=A0A0H5LTY1_YERIN|nr:Uncharacterised protein [Yersinia intermedia]
MGQYASDFLAGLAEVFFKSSLALLQSVMNLGKMPCHVKPNKTIVEL